MVLCQARQIVYHVILQMLQVLLMCSYSLGFSSRQYQVSSVSACDDMNINEDNYICIRVFSTISIFDQSEVPEPHSLLNTVHYHHN